MVLRPGPIADFYREVMGVLDELRLSTEIWPMPVEIEEAIPFGTDKSHVAHHGGVMWEAYSHEVSSAGYWRGLDGEGVFYSYDCPEPPEYRDASVSAAPASFDDGLGELTLPYTAVREADDPDALLLEFLQSTYDVAADTGNWNRAALERSLS
ncbi:MAG TPA: DUF5996 family protein [Mycobacterium sp.]|nr:DUF5996 family protein [Mycobacterium sp.]